MMNIVLLGAPGSGKGTQAERLAGELGMVHVASGDLFRENIRRETELGKLAQGYIQRGALVPDSVTEGMIRERTTRPDVTEGVLFDGFPRTRGQAEALEVMLAERGQVVDRVIYLEVSDEAIVQRLAGRLTCSECQLTFHPQNNPFRTCPYGKCEGQHLQQRDDDRPETVRARLKTYHDQTAPLIEYYSGKRLLSKVPGEGPVAQVSEAILRAVREEALR